MTYEAFISLVSREVRDRRAWPNDSSKLQEQLDMAYVSALAVATGLPLSRFSLSEEDLPGASITDSTTEVFPFPDDVFDIREDLGIHNLVINGKERFPFEAIRIDSVLRSGENAIQKDEVFFGLDMTGRNAFVSNGDSVALRYAPKPEKPTTSNYTETDYPLQEKDSQRAVHIISAHLSGVQIRDNAAATFHSMLEQFYSN